MPDTEMSGRVSADTLNWYDPKRPVIRNDQSFAKVALVDVEPESSSSIRDALTRTRAGGGSAPLGSATTWPEIEAPGPNSRERLWMSCSDTSTSLSANSPRSAAEFEGR